MKHSKKIILLLLVITMNIGTCSLVFARDIQGIESNSVIVDGVEFHGQLYAYGYVIELNVSDVVNEIPYDKAELAVRIWYKDDNGNTYTKNFGNQTVTDGYTFYELPESYINIRENYDVYKIKGWYKVYKNGDSASNTIILE
ncbi:hypothetical protein [Vallitalea maricola]|uniref:Uncharacterized protein n=1 Tax=Vallitalea maricola TaxID=3074433 RepID=A0ACB5ULX9_9FIRM|nr:hypothetical protein AN2V17_31060 [Vallitalea sp. AN17-2]